MSIARLMQQAAAGAAAGGGPLAIEDVFSTYLYTGNGSTQTITNDIDLAGEGGLVWFKARSGTYGTSQHALFDTDRGVLQGLASSLTSAEATEAGSLTAFNSDGFDLGSWSGVNGVGSPYASWTFRKAPRFFDVVTYTGTGAAQTIAHNLGTDVGTIIVKRTDSTSDWSVWHRSYGGSGGVLNLNENWAGFTGQNHWNSTLPTSTEFSLGAVPAVNTSGGTYVAYLFAHDPLGPSGDGSDGLIACGSYTGTGAAIDVDLGWEPQFVIVKNASATNNWLIVDNMRGAVTSGSDAVLAANTSSAESSFNEIDFTSTGFRENNSINSGQTYIYIAIRRGPMRQPTSGTEVFEPSTALNSWDFGVSVSTSFPIDLIIQKSRGSVENWTLFDRMRGGTYLSSNTTSAETSSAATFGQDFFSLQSNISANGDNRSFNVFRRAPGFFDVVAYTGTGSAQNISHNLGVVPELMIVKNRDQADAWAVYYGDNTDYLVLNTTAATADDNTYWNDTSPTASVFTVGTADSVNVSTEKYIAYLFASLPGVSKIGTYTGNGSSQTINCGFTGGARFVLIKRTDSTGDWLVGDTARGIVAGNDPYLELNTTAVEDTDEDWLDPDSSGFIVNETSTANANVNTATYIYLAIA